MMYDLQTTLDEIRASVITLDSGLRMAKHPLYNHLWTHEDQDMGADGFGKQWFEKHIEYKLKSIAKADAERDWESIIFQHERPWRVDVLADLVRHKLTGTDDLTPIIFATWIDTEWPHQSKSNWRLIFSSVTVEQMNAQLDDAEKQARKAFIGKRGVWPTIYRGVNLPAGGNLTNYVQSFSWTSNKAKAKWFAHRLKGDHAAHVAKASVPVDELVGPIQGRGEDEYLILQPERVFNHLNKTAYGWELEDT